MSRWRSFRPPRSPANSAAARIDFGVTGEDLMREGLADCDQRVEVCARLGFGHADVVVAVPDFWLDVDTMADLGDVAADFRARHGRRLAIATKYWRLTQQLLLRHQRHPALSHRRKPRRHRRRAGLRFGRHHRRYHLNRLDAEGQPPEGALRRRDPEVRGLPRARPKARARRRRAGGPHPFRCMDMRKGAAPRGRRSLRWQACGIRPASTLRSALRAGHRATGGRDRRRPARTSRPQWPGPS